MFGRTTPSSNHFTPRRQTRITVLLLLSLWLQVITPPLRLPKIDIYQYWHNRFHRDPGNQWIRLIFKSLFSKSLATPR